ncbi:MAG: hypothetical protein HUU22_04490 [Phycisphaerae bacterium]|nr:hypothetical protein [Phycisphaerae bacterium]NUQ45275.1 hypothetical protein [Phycisphaerae bacterium]
MKHTWPYLNTPLTVYLIVMLPINGLMAFVAASPHRDWIRLTACAVIALSGYSFLRGYVRRLRIDEQGVSFVTLGSRHTMAWRDVRRIDCYVPNGGVNGPKYVFVTSQDRPPRGKWEVDSRTFQVQDRPGLLDALRDSWRRASAQ